MSDADFEEQIRLAEEEKEKRDKLQHGRTKVDEDGTVMEWDADKKAWFPKIDADFIAKYQMTYGAYEKGTTDAEAGSDTSTPGNSLPAGAPPVTDPSYAQWYYSWYNQAGQKTQTKITDSHTTQQESGNQYTTEDYYKYYQQTQGNKGNEGASASYDEEANKEYWKKYYEYYYGQQSDTQTDKADVGNDGEEKNDDKKKNKKDKKRKAAENQNQGWFDVESQHNTNVYVSGLPTDITEEEYETTMKKCGLLMFDPRLKKPKLKLYKDTDGNLKGDGLCCYIKPESVELALQILDGYDLRGHTLHVEKAEFKMKGEFDPTKKKKVPTATLR